jgi:hypothetical protein
MKDVGKLYGDSVHFNVIWCILWPFGIFCGHFGIFFPFLVCRTKKNLATLILNPNPTTSKFTTTTPSLGKAKAFLKYVDENIIVFQTH